MCFQSPTVEAEQVFVVLRRRGDLDDGDGEAVGGRGEDSRSQRHVVFVQELCAGEFREASGGSVERVRI